MTCRSSVKTPSDPQEFPIPFAVSGVKPKLAPPKNSADSSAKRPPAAATSKAPSPGDYAQTRVLADDDDDDDDDDDADLCPRAPKKKAATGASKAKAKPLTIDPKLLERPSRIATPIGRTLAASRL